MSELSRALLLSLLVFVAKSGSGAELRIDQIDFDEVEQPGARDPWYQVAITFNVVRGDEGDTATPRFADDVSVRLSLATRNERTGGELFSFYQASADYPTLEVGRKVARFYLPPSVVSRDRVGDEPYAYEIEIFSGESVAVSYASRRLDSEPALASFRGRVASEAAATAGILRLQQETPFWQLDPENTPHPKLRFARNDG